MSGGYICVVGVVNVNFFFFVVIYLVIYIYDRDFCYGSGYFFDKNLWVEGG